MVVMYDPVSGKHWNGYRQDGSLTLFAVIIQQHDIFIGCVSMLRSLAHKRWKALNFRHVLLH